MLLEVPFKKVCSNRESNPEHKLGKLVLYHLTITALVNYLNKPYFKSFMIKKLIVLLTLLIFIAGCGGNEMKNNPEVKLETTQGDIVIELYEKEIPITAGNFKKLVQEKYYDGVIFHRVIDGFMIQGGDPTGTGMGGPGYEIKDEFTKTALDRNDRGTIAMANAGPNTGGSQFFINLVNNNFLDGKHPVFGKIIDGMEVVDKIAKVQKDSQDKPLQDVVINRAYLI